MWKHCKYFCNGERKRHTIYKKCNNISWHLEKEFIVNHIISKWFYSAIPYNDFCVSCLPVNRRTILRKVGTVPHLSCTTHLILSLSYLIQSLNWITYQIFQRTHNLSFVPQSFSSSISPIPHGKSPNIFVIYMIRQWNQIDK